jgi:pimeloyl-ACP methyl ester carboxylesterase
MKRYHTLLLLLSILIPGLAGAQRTGSYDTSISFMSGTRALAIHVPAAYTPSNKYQLMVCLHGLGDTASDYRDALVNLLGWGAAMPNTIFVCPEAVTRSSDFFSPTGGEAIIQQSMDYAMQVYHIDTADVVLQGFSLGGRAALRYGLDNPATFRGLLLNTPAVQGVKEAVNGQPLYPFTYSNGSRIPIYITHGATDITYGSVLDSVYEQLVLHDAIVQFTRYPGLGHTLPPLAQMPFQQFFAAPSHSGADIDAVKIYSPLLNCAAQTTPSLLFRNTGMDTIRSARFTYMISGSPQTASWTGTLLPYQHGTVPLSVAGLTPGASITISAQADTVNGNADTVTANNQQSGTVKRAGAALTALNEGFEGSFPPSGWTLEEAGDFYTAWVDDNTVARTGSQSVNAFNTIFFFDNSGRSEGLITPAISLPAVKPMLSFDVAYNYHRYTPPYLTATVDFADTLEVLISNDCGASYTRLYKKGGADLATFSNPILNPLAINDLFAAPADSNWRTERIDLSGYPSGGNDVFVKFNYISALGGSINIDNVQIGSATSVAGAASRPGFRVYPNPASGEVRVASSGEAIRKLEVVDMAGRKVLSATAEDQHATLMTLDTRNLPAGIYMLQIHAADGMRMEKLSIKK